MNRLAILYQWLVHHPLSVAAALFGGITLVVMLVTYVQNYKMLVNQDVEAGR